MFSRRTILAALLTAGCASGPPDTQKSPNILLLVAEDMSTKVGAFGDPVAVTPNLDALAAEGVIFPNTYTTAGVCAPSRAALITGMHQAAIGAQHMRTSSFSGSPYRTVPPPAVKAFPELLRQAGYYTFTNHKLDYQFSDVRSGSGPFTIWSQEGRGSGWSGRASGQPFFGMINYNQTHESRLFSRNADPRAEKPIAPENVQIPPYYPDTPVTRQDIAQQYNNIFKMDKQVGKILARLKREGLDKNTIVIWTADHGDGLPRAKRELFDSGIRVPMIIRWPEKWRPRGLQVGGEDQRLVSFVDLAPTILHMAGAGFPRHIHGRALFAHRAKPRRYVYAAKDRLDQFPNRERAVRGPRYKYIRNYMPGEPGAQDIAYRNQLNSMSELRRLAQENRLAGAARQWFLPRPKELLFDTWNDPHEIDNLADKPAHVQKLKEMRRVLETQQRSMRDFSVMTEEEMAEQFWPRGQQPVTRPPVIRVDKRGWAHIRSPSEGASIGYRINRGEWKVYRIPLRLQREDVLTAKAVRYGWRESATRSVVHE